MSLPLHIGQGRARPVVAPLILALIAAWLAVVLLDLLRAIKLARAVEARTLLTLLVLAWIALLTLRIAALRCAAARRITARTPLVMAGPLVPIVRAA